MAAELELVVPASADLSAGCVVFKMPPIGGVGTMQLSVAMNGVDYVPVPDELSVYERLSLASLLPALGLRTGGTQVELYGEGLRHSDTLRAVFVKGASRLVAVASYDESKGCAVCTSPSWDAASKGGEGAPDDGDVIVELALNAQQFTISCLHYTFADWEVSDIEPKVGPLLGGAEVKITGVGFVGSSIPVVKFVRGDTGEEVSVEGALGDDGAILCTTPSFEGADAPFDTSVFVAMNGQQYRGRLLTEETPDEVGFRFDGAPPKAKK